MDGKEPKIQLDMVEEMELFQSAVLQNTSALIANIQSDVSLQVKDAVDNLNQRFDLLDKNLKLMSKSLIKEIKKLDRGEMSRFTNSSTPTPTMSSRSPPEDTTLTQEDTVILPDDEHAPVTSLEELDKDLATAVERCIPLGLSSNEKLTGLQYGYLVYQIGKMNIRSKFHKPFQDVHQTKVPL